MSEREIEAGNDIILGSAEFDALSPEQQQMRVAMVRQRASSIDTLSIPGLPDTLWGEWVPDDHQSILHHTMLGFKVDEQYAAKSSVNQSNRHGDCVFMVQPMSLHNLIESDRQHEYNERHGVKSGSTREEIEFASSKPDELPGQINKSNTETLSGDQIKAALGGT